MNRWKNAKLEYLSDCTASFSADGRKRLENIGVPRKLLNIIQTLLHKHPCKRPAFLHRLIAACLLTHAPERAFLRLGHFLDAGGSDFAGLSADSDTPLILARVFASSGALSGRINADPSLPALLSETARPLRARVGKKYYFDRLKARLGGYRLITERKRALHLEHTVQLMRICARNADPSIPITEINMELSSLAEAVVEACLLLAYDEISARIGKPIGPHSLVVLGLGKLGGRELNVSSDIDLIYLYGDGENIYGNYDGLGFHTVLAERLTRILGEATEHGTLYRVDTRLRADGASGPLVRTPSDYLRYLEMRGEAWERQILLKARPVAGVLDVGRSFLESVEHFVFPASISRSPNREIVELKNRIEARIVADGSEKTHLKLVPGGIRDIEFVVQCLQLLMGGTRPEVRCRGTIPALDRLGELGALSAEEHEILSDAYILYRRVENALQWRELLPSFVMPDDPGELQYLAAFLGYDGPEGTTAGARSLLEDLENHMKVVREIYNTVFGVTAPDSFEEKVLFAVEHPGDDGAGRFMESMGFRDSHESASKLLRLALGENGETSGLDPDSPVGRFLPKLLKALSELPDPGGALERFVRVTESYGARHTLIEILDSNPPFFELLLTITHASAFITELIVRDPSLLDWLVEAGEIVHPMNGGEIRRELVRLAEGTGSDEHFTRACLAVKNREKLRIGVRDVTGLADTRETFSALTELAECTVKCAYARARKNISPRSSARGNVFAVMAAGRLGAGMMDFGSDLDLIFIYGGSGQSESPEAQERAIRLSQHILSLITGGGGAYKIYDVDARLRPEGGNAPLAVSIDEYKRYLLRRASVWERLALIRTRTVAGDNRLGRETLEAIRDFVYQRPFSPEEIEKLMRIRETMREASSRRYPGRINIKSGAGGLFDIDFAAQAYAAHYGARNVSLRHRGTPGILEALGKTGILPAHEARTLAEMYEYLCNVEKALRIGSGLSINALPDSEAEKSRVSRLLGYRNVRRFMKRLEDVTSLTAELYESLMNRLLSAACGERPTS